MSVHARRSRPRPRCLCWPGPGPWPGLWLREALRVQCDSQTARPTHALAAAAPPLPPTSLPSRTRVQPPKTSPGYTPAQRGARAQGLQQSSGHGGALRGRDARAPRGPQRLAGVPHAGLGHFIVGGQHSETKTKSRSPSRGQLALRSWKHAGGDAARLCRARRAAPKCPHALHKTTSARIAPLQQKKQGTAPTRVPV